MRLLGSALALVLVCSLLTAAAPQEADARGGEEHFKYGSVGIEAEEGLPYWIWQVLPRLFADKLPGPGGYGSLGIVWEPGRELPIGFSKRNVLGSPRVAVNCAFCHTATFRTLRGGARTIVPGGPAHQAAPQAFSRFLEAAAADPRFNASDMLDAISKMGTLSWTDSVLYRWLYIPATRRALLRHREEFAWMDERPAWGRGRIDPLNPFKYRQLGQPLDQTIGNSDMPPLWALGLRHGRGLHWDGLNPSLDEVLIGSAIGNGASVKSVDHDSLRRVGEWLRTARPPAYPFAIDGALAQTGATVFASSCATCHAETGSRMGSVVPIDEVGTDRHRLDTWTAASAAAFNGIARGYPWQPKSYRKTNGYVAMPLVGVWLNAPYLHNGSVPSLTDLLEPPARRPVRFYRGYDVYDPTRIGFVTAGEEARTEGDLFDTNLRGNGNGGHVYGTTLAPDQKTALLEYLKTM
jgi:hypothetical protein